MRLYCAGHHERTNKSNKKCVRRFPDMTLRYAGSSIYIRINLLYTRIIFGLVDNSKCWILLFYEGGEGVVCARLRKRVRMFHRVLAGRRCVYFMRFEHYNLRIIILRKTPSTDLVSVRKNNIRRVHKNKNNRSKCFQLEFKNFLSSDYRL